MIYSRTKDIFGETMVNTIMEQFTKCFGELSSF